MKRVWRSGILPPLYNSNTLFPTGFLMELKKSLEYGCTHGSYSCIICLLSLCTNRCWKDGAKKDGWVRLFSNQFTRPTTTRMPQYGYYFVIVKHQKHCNTWKIPRKTGQGNFLFTPYHMSCDITRVWEKKPSVVHKICL